MPKKLFFTAVVLWVSLSSWNCDKKPVSPIVPNNNQFPAQPRDLVAAVSDRQVTLSWNIDDPSTVKFYRIYRRDSTAGAFAFLDTSSARQYGDRDLNNNLVYFYQVSAVNAKGFEGKRSASVAAIPRVYAITIESNAEYVSKALVTIQVTAPPRTALMMLGNDSLFTNSTWQGYTPVVQWTLSSGDGKKTVYVKFRDEEGNESSGFAKDSIILDTTALITDVTEDTKGQIKKFGETIHFTVATSESPGKATVSFVPGPQDIPLFDDGTHGDKKARDGIYELNYTIPQDVQVIQAKVRGNFTDRVGNIAVPVTAAGLVTIQKNPDPVTLFPPTALGTQHALRLTWSASKDTFDFANYSIYRSVTSNFTPQANLLIDRVPQMLTTSYIDVNLQPGVTYYYRLLVFDTAALSSVSSNEVSGRLTANPPPAPVVLSTPMLVGDLSSQVQLSWSQSPDPDFSSYRIYRSTTSRVDSLSPLIKAITDQNETLYIDHGLKAATTYYYRVYVYDQSGGASGSNIASVTTAPNLPPTPVVLALPAAIDTTSLQLSWSQNHDADFDSYRIFRTTTGQPAIDPTKQNPIHIINTNAANTTYVDTGLARKTKYTYQVFVYDKAGLYSGSNQVQGSTR